MDKQENAQLREVVPGWDGRQSQQVIIPARYTGDVFRDESELAIEESPQACLPDKVSVHGDESADESNQQGYFFLEECKPVVPVSFLLPYEEHGETQERYQSAGLSKE